MASRSLLGHSQLGPHASKTASRSRSQCAKRALFVSSRPGNTCAQRLAAQSKGSAGLADGSSHFPSHAASERCSNAETVHSNSRRQLLLSSASFVALTLGDTGVCWADEEEEVDDDLDFYATWPYQKASDILPFVRKYAKDGDSDSVLDAMDRFGDRYPMWKLGPEKGRILETIIKDRDPNVVVEVGTFLGYSAIRTARTLKQGARLVCVEGSPEYAKVAREMLDMAGVGSRVEIIIGVASDVLPDVAKKVPRADLIFEDHGKQCYTPDLKQMEALGMVVPGTWVVADNVVHPGAPGFLEHLVPANGYASTELLEAAFEYEEPWREGDVGAREDAISLSKFVGVPAEKTA